ncbi:MerR family transcriptional regulator [Clostridium sp. C2-6-12]|uniref:MerR family transcriptional regulator n=1 Tax=Clostridium sp. C2-6-12 TaxID=2698832 RepID=UPI00136A825C|nr:MerR family transcriptional regulator [Clostridium sp. C2-6-12]
MGYSIAEAAEKIDLSTYTLRYYDKMGLLPFVERNELGNRDFKEKDLEWLKLIRCLKNSNMPIKKIKEVIKLSLEGDDTLSIRKEILSNHRKEVVNKIEELHKSLDKIDNKINYYERASKSI